MPGGYGDQSVSEAETGDSKASWLARPSDPTSSLFSLVSAYEIEDS